MRYAVVIEKDSKYSPDSINNEYGAGSPYGAESPNNPYGQGLSIYGDDDG